MQEEAMNGIGNKLDKLLRRAFNLGAEAKQYRIDRDSYSKLMAEPATIARYDGRAWRGVPVRITYVRPMEPDDPMPSELSLADGAVRPLRGPLTELTLEVLHPRNGRTAYLNDPSTDAYFTV